MRATFESAREPDQLAVRECQCSFCRAHAALSVADPQGSLVISIGDEAQVSRYRFGPLRMADMLVCRECGVYVGAVMQSGDKLVGILNLRSAPPTLLLDREPSRVSYDGEGEEERRSRRERLWTPTTVRVR